MEALRIARMEKFCQIVALEDCDGSDAAYRAGYGIKQHPIKDQYHVLVASRLLQREDVCLRINTIRQQNAEADKDFTKSLINDLKRIIKFDHAQYYQSSTVKLPNGRQVTDCYMNIPIQNWPREERALMFNGFYPNGAPRFIDKQWAWEKLLKIYNLDGKAPVDVEDILGLFASAGLPMSAPQVVPIQSVAGSSDIDAEIASDLEE